MLSNGYQWQIRGVMLLQSVGPWEQNKHVSSTSQPVSMEMLPTLYLMAGLFKSIWKTET